MFDLLFSITKAVFNSIYYTFPNFNKNDLFINFVESISKDNIFYIKIFQGIGSNINIFNEKQIVYLKKFLDSVPYNNSDINKDFINSLKCIGKNNKDLEIDLDSLKIINSGIIGIVYKGYIQEKEIVVKVIKNNIENKVFSAIKNYEKLINFITFFGILKFYYIDDLFFSNKELLLKQLDFVNEMNNIKVFYKNNENTDYVVIPKVYDEFTLFDNKIIVMDYLDGKKIDVIDNDEKEIYLEQIVQFSFKSILFNKYFHCDLHPGNIIFLDNPKRLGIIDFGIVGEITREEQNIIYNFFHELFKKSNYLESSKILLNNCSKPLINTSNLELKVDNSNVVDISNLTKDLMNNKFNLDATFINKVNKILYKENLKLAEFFCKIELAFGISDSVCKILSNDSNLIFKAVNIFDNLNL